jgi:putative ABC transport system ATP-binding protein
MLMQLKNIIKVCVTDIAEVRALKGIDLEVDAGAFTAVSGPSGSGKSTLLNIVGLLDDATSGEYYFDGEKIDNSNEQHINHLRDFDLGFIFQDFNLSALTSAISVPKTLVIFLSCINITLHYIENNFCARIL